MIIIFIAFVNAITAVCAAPTKGFIMESRLENFYQCPNTKSISNFTNMVVKRINARETRLYGDIIIVDQMDEINMKVELFKCASKSEPDTCEYYTALKLPSFCQKLETKTSPWWDYFNATTMPNHCPIPKGNYKVGGVKIGIDNSFPLFDGFWRFKNRGTDGKGKTVLCFIMEMNIHRKFKL